MKTYELSLFHKQQKFLIDNTLFYNCKDRNEALSRVKKLMLYQGLSLSKFGYTLKKTNKIKDFVVD